LIDIKNSISYAYIVPYKSLILLILPYFMTVKKNNFYYKTNNLGKLQVFIKMYEEGSTAITAQALGISQPAVSMQIKATEDLVGCKLFEKIGTKLVPTTHAYNLYNSIHRHIGKIDFAIHNLKTIKQSVVTKEIRISVHHIFATRVLGKYLKNIDSSVKFFIHDYSRDEAIKKLRSNEVDFAIYPFYNQTPSLVNDVIVSYKPLLAMHKSNPLAAKTIITPQDIASQNLIKIKKELIILPLFNQFAEEYKWQSRIQFDTPDWALLTHLVSNNLGIAVVSEMCLNDNTEIIFKDLSHIFPAIEYSLIVNSSVIYNAYKMDVIKIFSPELFAKIKHFT
jgi:DNA-binding transcriptional LysR family regulator